MSSDGPWEYRRKDSSEPWEFADENSVLVWNWDDFDYRIAPEPPKEQWRPFTFETAPMHTKARKKSMPQDVGVAELLVDGFLFDLDIYSFQRALDELEQLDGTPLGVKVESEEWPKLYVNRSRRTVWTITETSGSWKDIDGNMGISGCRPEDFNPDGYYRITAAEADELLKGGAK